MQMVLIVVLLLWATPLCMGARTAESRVLEAFENDMVNDGYYLEEELVDDSFEMKKKYVLKQKNVITISMPGVKPQHKNAYMCVSKKLPPGTNYIVKYEPQTKIGVTHHMILFGCDTPIKVPGDAWMCEPDGPFCGQGGKSSVLYLWTEPAPSLTMPPNVGVRIGGNSGVRYLVLQVHYLNVKKFKGPGAVSDHSGVKITYDGKNKQYLAGVRVLDSVDGYPPIPPHKSKFHVNIGFKVKSGPTIYPFRFCVHAHKLGRVITAYRVRNNKWTIIGRGDPQRPQAFYTVQKDMDVKPGDLLIGRCTYNTMSRDQATKIFAMHNDEMCNFDVMYYYGSESVGNKFECTQFNLSQISQFQYPKCSDVMLMDMKQKKCMDSAE